MSWFNFGRIVGYTVRLLIFAYIFFDAYLKIVKSESFIINIIAYVLMLMYTSLGSIAMFLRGILESTASLAYMESFKFEKKQSINDFEKLLNDFGDSEWKLD